MAELAILKGGVAHAGPGPAASARGVSAVELTLPDGLVGLPALRRFVLSPLERTPFFRLDSLDDPAFGVVAALANDIRPGSLDGLVLRSLAAPGSTTLVLLSTHGDPPAITANLAGPIVVDTDATTARQLVLDDPAYPLRAPVGAQG